MEAVTMVGTKRLENLQTCCCTALEEEIPGDFVETGSGEVAVEFSCVLS
ncbi:MAG: hypothetical protein DME43_07280 [Verrucomicrobia bacterium]|nr:MAG: hypothetical protein DME43_07280 [Verrucomicrobiota bacterium]PYK73772.1 MAG: hypothetical protein DME44_00290 [Verrucomicrobiota bacterium]